MRLLACFAFVWLLMSAAHADTVPLSTGWNAVAFPYKTLTSLEATGVAGMVYYDGTAYQSRACNLATVGSEGGTFRGFWIYSPGGGSVTFAGTSTGASSLSLRAGWNLVGFPEAAGLELSQLRPSGLLIYEAGATSPATRLAPGKAYWVFAPSATTVEWGAAPTGSNIYVAIGTHNEDTPDFANDKNAYRSYRSSLLQFAQMMRTRNLPWNWQSDWSFLNAVIRYDITERDTEFLAQTEGLNVVQYLKQRLDVEIDPHSHEKMGYNYADVAYLVTQTGVDPSPVVGGHIWDPAEATFQNWPKFIGGLRGTRYPSYTWTPSLLMGAGTPNHRNDPVATGIWNPAASDQFFTHSPSGTLATWGGWNGDETLVNATVSELETLDRNSMWTATYVINQGDMPKPGYLTGTLAPQLDAIAALRDAGRIQVVKFEQGLAAWRSRYGGQGFVYRKS